MTEQQFRRPSALISLATVVILSACSTTPVPPNKPGKYPTYEMSSAMVRPVFPTGDQNLAWIDDERILFEGLDRKLRDPIETNQGVHVAMRGLYIWNIRTNEVIRYTREPLRSFLCFADGYVSYSVYRDGRTARIEGPFGKEQEIEAPPEIELRRNPFTCKSYERSTLPKLTVGGGIEPLRPEHGWIEHTGNSTWFRSVDGKLTPLAAGGRPIGTVRPQKYSPYSQRYIFWRPSQTWLIASDGTLVQQPPPAGTPSDGRLEPAHHGKTLLRSTRLNVRAEWDPGQAGLYLYAANGGFPERLLTGLIRAMQVHRGGCMVGAIVDPWNREEREHQLKAVNVCG